ncbi:MAG: peptidoglycan DD-metalloendopeptidase family protein [Oscillospiraceae bacterium]
MRKNKLFGKLVATILCLLLVMPMSAFAESLDDIRAQQENLRSQAANLETELDSLRGDEAKAAEYKAALGDKITLTQKRIDSAISNIQSLNTNITELEKKLKESQAEYSSTMEQLKERIKAIYKSGNVGTVQILLSATSLNDFSMRTEALKSFTEHDKQLMEMINGYMVATQTDRDSMAKQKEEVATLKKQLEMDQKDLTALDEENDRLIVNIQSEQATKEAKIAQLDEEDAALNSRISDLIAQKKREEEEAKKQQEAEAAAKKQQAEEEARKQQEEEERKKQEADANGGDATDTPTEDQPKEDPPKEDPPIEEDTPGGGDDSGMSDGFSPKWPLPGYDTSWITQWYGNGHNGLDIAAPYGTPIVASQAGQVLSAEYHYSWGNNVLLYHNGTYSTRYAHMSSMAVSPGEYVERGQIIGYVGDTGNSFGDHLHFEVYLDGYRVDPYPYL